MEISNLSDAEFKTVVIRMLKELREGLSGMEKVQAEMKDTLFEIKNNLNLQGNNSRKDQGNNQINDLEHKQAKKTTMQNNEKKRKYKNMRIL